MRRRTQNRHSALLAHALNLYLKEIVEQYALCEMHEANTAVHTRGKELQIYKLYDRNSDVASIIRRHGSSLPTWDHLPYWPQVEKKFSKLKQDVVARMTKHGKQHPVFTEGIMWEGRPILLHAYKFEPDPMLKLELILPKTDLTCLLPELPLKIVASALRCHEYIVPSFVTIAKPPYERHEAAFKTIREYLIDSMPVDAYATKYLNIRHD